MFPILNYVSRVIINESHFNIYSISVNLLALTWVASQVETWGDKRMSIAYKWCNGGWLNFFHFRHVQNSVFMRLSYLVWALWVHNFHFSAVRQRVNYVTCRILLQSCVHSITNSLVLYHEARKETQLAVMRSKKWWDKSIICWLTACSRFDAEMNWTLLTCLSQYMYQRR